MFCHTSCVVTFLLRHCRQDVSQLISDKNTPLLCSKERCTIEKWLNTFVVFAKFHLLDILNHTIPLIIMQMTTTNITKTSNFTQHRRDNIHWSQPQRGLFGELSSRSRVTDSFHFKGTVTGQKRKKTKTILVFTVFIVRKGRYRYVYISDRENCCGYFENEIRKYLVLLIFLYPWFPRDNACSSGTSMEF